MKSHLTTLKRSLLSQRADLSSTEQECQMLLQKIEMLSKLDKEVAKTCELLDQAQSERDKMKTGQEKVQDCKTQIEELEQVIISMLSPSLPRPALLFPALT